MIFSMNKIVTNSIGFLIILAVIVGSLYYIDTSDTSKGKYVDLAKALTKNGAIFYGAFWCPNCGEQKALLGDGVKEINYIECSLPDRSGQYEICEEENIQSYPTWKFENGLECYGVIHPEVLASIIGFETGNETTTQELAEEIYFERYRRGTEDVEETIAAVKSTFEENLGYPFDEIPREDFIQAVIGLSCQIGE